MWRYIVTNSEGGYVFAENHPEHPAIFVKRADAHAEAKEWAKATGERFKVHRVSTRNGAIEKLIREYDTARPPQPHDKIRREQAKRAAMRWHTASR